MILKKLIGIQSLTCVVVVLLTCAAVHAQVGGTPGKIAKFKTSSSVSDSVITEDKFGKVGVGTDLPTSKLTVAGTIESLAGGIKFPDGTTQTTAGVSSIFHNPTLAGNGSAGSPLGIAFGGVGTNELANNAVTAGKIAFGQVVRSVNGITDQVTLVAGQNITVTPNGNTLTIASSVKDPSLSAFQETMIVNFDDGVSEGNDGIGVPPNKRLVIEYVTLRAQTKGFIDECSLETVVNGTIIDHTIIPLQVGSDNANLTKFRADKTVRIYADGLPSLIRLKAHRTSPDFPGSIRITISGYLVDIP